jgi:hypothetical protein
MTALPGAPSWVTSDPSITARPVPISPEVEVAITAHRGDFGHACWISCRWCDRVDVLRSPPGARNGLKLLRDRGWRGDKGGGYACPECAS